MHGENAMKEENTTVESLLADIEDILKKQENKQSLNEHHEEVDVLKQINEKTELLRNALESEKQEASIQEQPEETSIIDETEENPEKTESLVDEDISKKPKKHNFLKWIGDVGFYLCIIVFLSSLFFLKGGNTSTVRSMAGFSGFTVLSNSMYPEIHKDSFVLTKKMDPLELQEGDTITFLNDPSSTVTHKIVGIIENYQDTGKRDFETKGVANVEKDRLPVLEDNVVGKVIFHNYEIGRILIFLKHKLFYIVLLYVLSYGLFQ